MQDSRLGYGSLDDMRNNIKNGTTDHTENRRYMDSAPCYASMTTLTNAMKAQKLLSLNAIPSNLIKNQDPDSKRGCAYRITFSCTYERNVRAIFEREGVRVKGWNGREDW